MNQSDEINDLKNRVGILEVKYDGIKERLDKIDGGINKLMWLILGTIITYIVTSLIHKGGV